MGLDVGGYAIDRTSRNGAFVSHSLMPRPRDPDGEMEAVIRSAPPPTRNDEIQFAINLTHRVVMALISKYESIFPQKKVPWYQANDEDVQK